MKISTHLLFISFLFFNTALLAKPVLSTFSVSEDTLLAEATIKLEDFNNSPATKDTVTNKAESLAPTVLVINDFCGQGSGSIDITPDPNTPGPWVYHWSNLETTQDLTGLTGGTYTITIVDANGDEQIEQVVVGTLGLIVPPEAHAVATGNTVCVGTYTGALDITVIPLTAPWTYLWSTGATTQDVTGLNHGTHTVSVTVGVTCTTIFEFTVPDNANSPHIDIMGAGASSCEREDGSAGYELSGGVQPFTYLWSNGFPSRNLVNVPSGTYTVTVTGANGCTDVDSVFVPNINYQMLIELGSIVPNTTCIGANGSINITEVHSIVQQPFTYLWDNGATTQDLINVPSGSYGVTVTLNWACFVTEIYYVEDAPAFPAISFNNTNTTCGMSNGYVNLTPLPGGTPPYTYLWSNGATTQDLSNVPAGSYDVTITGTNGCPFEQSATIDDVPILFNYSALITDQYACDTTNGEINLSLFPANLSYQWSNGATTKILKNLAPGTYTVTISAGGTCTAVETYEVGDVREYPSIPALLDTSTCGLANGAIDLFVLGNAATPFTYLWSNGATTQDLTGILADTFSVTVTSAVGCSNTNTFIVPNFNDTIRVQGNVLDNLSCLLPTGNIALNISPIDSNYTYLWSTGATTDSLSNLAAGDYRVTVTLGVSCIALDTFAVANDSLPPNLSASSTSTNCGLNNGAADLTVNGGVGPFSFIWSNAATTEDLADLIPGNYSVTVTGSNSCTAINSVSVLNNNIAFNVSAAPVANSSCTAANGSVDISVNPAGSYSYQWSNAAITEDINGLPSGAYTVTVTLGTCQSTGTFAVADITSTPVLGSNITASICSEDNGGIDLNVGGPSGPYTYIWSNLVTTEDLADLLPGNYSVTVTAPNGCTEVVTLNVANNASNFSLAATPAPLTDCATDNGAIDLNISPAGAYTYLWSNMATTEDLNSLPPGTYTVSVTELGSCTATASYFVIDQRTNPISSQAIVPEFCGQTDGSIDLSVSGGTAPFGYVWQSGQTTQDLANIAAGNYIVTVTDANNCTVTANAVVPGNTISFALAGAASSNSSCLQNNGAIDLSVNPPPPGGVSYQWSNLAITEDLSGLNAGTYTVTVSAGGNCTNTAAFTITNDLPSPVLSQNIAAALCGQSSGSIDLSVMGSPAPHTYLWSVGAMTEDLLNLASGSYTVTVTADNGCTSVEIFTVPENTVVPNIGSTVTQSTSCVVSNGAIDLTVTPPSATGYTFLWAGGQTDEDLYNLAAGTYFVTVNGGGACTNTASLTVGSTIPLPAIADNIAAATCGQASGSIDLSVTGSPAPYTFLWSNAAMTEDLLNIVSGQFSVTVTADNGCTSVGSFTVPENVVTPALNSLTSPANSCLAFNGAIDLTINFALGYSVLWSNGSLTEDLANLAAGTYTVTVNGGGACTASASFSIADQTTQPQANIASINTALDCNTVSAKLNGSVTGTSNPTTFLWSSNGTPLGGNGSLSVNSPGQYELWVQDDVTFCTSTASITVTQNLNPPALSVANPALLTCTSPSQTLTGSSTVGGVQFSWATIVGTDTTILGNGAALPVSAAGNYYLIGLNPANNCANAISVNVMADQDPPSANAGTSFTLDCAGETAPLNGSGSGGANLDYQWSSADGHFVSGANSPTPLIDEAGTYLLLVTNPANGCTDTDAVTIEPEVPVAFASVVQPTCLDEQGIVQLDSVTGLSDPILYSLNGSQPGSQNQFANLVPGTYTLEVLGGNDCSAATTVVVEAPDLVEISLVPAATINLGYTYQIDATVNIPDTEIASVNWTPATSLACDTCLSTEAKPLSTTQYELWVVSKAGCEARGSLLLTVDKTRRIYGPNIFSPDGDGTNDVFTVFADPFAVVRVRSLQVFSRWGEQVFEQLDFTAGDVATGWDGTFKGQKLNPAVFVWQAVVEFVDGKEELFMGDVTLQR